MGIFCCFWYIWLKAITVTNSSFRQYAYNAFERTSDVVKTAVADPSFCTIVSCSSNWLFLARDSWHRTSILKKLGHPASCLILRVPGFAVSFGVDSSLSGIALSMHCHWTIDANNSSGLHVDLISGLCWQRQWRARSDVWQEPLLLLTRRSCFKAPPG